jgi:hypothetical protein
MPVSRARVEALLGVDEHAQLDHKRRIDLGNRRDVVELTKDIAAMMALGGDILIGTDDDGRIAGDMDESLARKFDEAKLRDQVGRYLDPSFRVRVGIHMFPDGWVVALNIEPSSDGVAVIRADGAYEIESGGVMRPKIVFRPGDVFVRHGSKSERWSQNDVRDLVLRIREREKAQWLMEHEKMSQPLLERQGEAIARELARSSQPPLPDDPRIAANAGKVPNVDDEELFNLWIILQLARIAGAEPRHLRMIEVEYEDAESTGLVRESGDWSNGETARSGDNWCYPNGKDANLGRRCWYWPTGRNACLGDAWYYPDGSDAMAGDQRWSLPGDSSTELDDDALRRSIRETCTPQEWHRYEAGLDAIYEDAYVLALLELAWTRLSKDAKRGR